MAIKMAVVEEAEDYREEWKEQALNTTNVWQHVEESITAAGYNRPVKTHLDWNLHLDKVVLLEGTRWLAIEGEDSLIL